jgi:hypothetical protein
MAFLYFGLFLLAGFLLASCLLVFLVIVHTFYIINLGINIDYFLKICEKKQKSTRIIELAKTGF